MNSELLTIIEDGPGWIKVHFSGCAYRIPCEKDEFLRAHESCWPLLQIHEIEVSMACKGFVMDLSARTLFKSELITAKLQRAFMWRKSYGKTIIYDSELLCVNKMTLVKSVEVICRLMSCDQGDAIQLVSGVLGVRKEVVATAIASDNARARL